MGVGMNTGIGDNTYSCQYRYNYRCRKGMLQAVLPGVHEVLTAVHCRMPLCNIQQN